MIARMWHGALPESKAEDYLEYLKKTGLPDYLSAPGNCGVYVFRRIENATAHFLLTSFWDSLESITAFAGEDIEKARYYPEDTDYLIELEPRVTHYEVLVGGDDQG